MKTAKEKILETGAQIVRRKGFNNTGLIEVLKETGVPKGSFYFYFSSKEQFGLALIDVYTSFMENKIIILVLIRVNQCQSAPDPASTDNPWTSFFCLQHRCGMN